jgi:hypothetical protein
MSFVGTFETCRRTLTMSAYRGRSSSDRSGMGTRRSGGLDGAELAWGDEFAPGEHGWAKRSTTEEPLLSRQRPTETEEYPGGRDSVQRIYIRLATESARLQPARSPLASSRLARAIAVENLACRRSWARFKESGVGWRSSCAPTDCSAVNPAFGFPADWRMAASN